MNSSKIIGNLLNNLREWKKLKKHWIISLWLLLRSMYAYINNICTHDK